MLIILPLSIFYTCLYSIYYILHKLAYNIVKIKYENPLTFSKYFLFIFITVLLLIFYFTNKEKGVGYVTVGWEKSNTRIII